MAKRPHCQFRIRNSSLGQDHGLKAVPIQDNVVPFRSARASRPGRGEGGSVGVYHYDIETRRTHWSAGLLRILGLPEDHKFGSLDAAIANVHPIERDRVRSEMGKISRRLGPYELEYRIVRPNGDIRQVRDTGEVFGLIDNCNDRGWHATGALVDITEQKTVDRSHSEANALLECLFEAAPVGLAVWDRDYRFVRINPALAGWNNLPIEAHLGKRPDEILPGFEDLDTLYVRWLEIMETGVPWCNVDVSGETPSAPGAERHWRETFFRVTQDGQALGIAAVVEETTERRKAEAAVRDHSNRLQRILDGFVGFVGILDPDGTLREINAPALEASNVTRAEVVGRKLWDTPWWRYDPQAAERLEDAVNRAESGKIVRYDETVRMQDDTRMVIDFLLSPIHDGSGRVVQLVSSGFDITARTEALERMQLLMQELNHRSKNVLTLVQAIARQTAQSGPDNFLDRFSERLNALAKAQDLLVSGSWRSVDLEALIRVQLAHFSNLCDARIRLVGPRCRITAETAESLGLTLHELATNAGKYGSLSNVAGTVTISWSISEGNAGPGRLSMAWIERDGPPVRTPTRRGFGSTLTGTMIRASLDAEVETTFAEDGLRWVLRDAPCVLPTDQRGG